jgi:hypothetical protein
MEFIMIRKIASISLRSILIVLGLMASNTVISPAFLPVSAQETCTFTGAPGLDSIPLYHAPLTHPSQQKEQILPGASYPVVMKNGAHFYITLDHAYGGWVDRRSGLLSGPCDQIPVDTTPLAGYPTICLFTNPAVLQLYNEPVLSTLNGTLPAGHYVVVQRSTVSYRVLLDDTFSRWVSAGGGQLSASCTSLPSESPMAATMAATALADARVWSAPSVQTSQILYTLAEGSQVVITGGPVQGSIQHDASVQGDWYSVYQSGTISGWVWSERLSLSSQLPPPDPSIHAAALDNARLWTVPDARKGSVVAFLDAGTQVTILAGPVRGPIRYDTPDEGDWYLVQPSQSTITGWIWADRLAFE